MLRSLLPLRWAPKSNIPQRPMVALPVRVAAAVALVCGGALAAPPNILFLMADQMRWDVLNTTFMPNLAALAAQGLTMGATYATTPSCTPSRAALLTGLSPWYHGMLGYGNVAVSTCGWAVAGWVRGVLCAAVTSTGWVWTVLTCPC